MKNRNGGGKRSGTKRNLNRAATRSRVGKRAKDRMLDELGAIAREMNIEVDGAVIRDSRDGGRRARVSDRRMHDETVAQGVFQGSRSGFGFVTPDEMTENGRDIFIPEGRCGGAIHGDRVEVIYHSYTARTGEEKTEGRVKKILEYGVKNVVGELVHEPSYMRRGRRIPDAWYVIPDDSRIGVRPRVLSTEGAHEGDKVLVRLDRRGDCAMEIRGEILSSFGAADSRGANYEAILAECEIATEFSEQELQQAAEAAKRPIDGEGRVEFRGLTVLTIDGEDAKDLDDAVSVKRLPNGWRLYVHIADVSSYIDERTPLDRAVMSRGTSVYFVDKVVPMLPVALSNGACSLGAGERKAALSAIVTLDEDGEIVKCEVVQSVIESKVRGVYSEVNALLGGSATAEIKKKYAPVKNALLRMQELYEVLLHRSRTRGAIELDAPEARIVLNADGEPVDIVRRERGVAERMIEQFMLMANEAVATLLTERGIPCVYRVHAEPPREKLETFLEFVHGLGFDTSYISMDKCSPADFSRLLDEAQRRGIGEQISYTMLRTMAKAEYSAVSSGHFGLGIELYCHFTSPIRRLSDLATHRIIHRVLIEGKHPAAYASYARRAAKAATDAEQRAVNAERRIEDLYKVVLMSSRVGECFDAAVSSLTSFGMFVTLENTCEGLIPISQMPGLFTFNEKSLTLRCGSLCYSLGDAVRVKLEEADIVRGKLRFSLCL